MKSLWSYHTHTFTRAQSSTKRALLIIAVGTAELFFLPPSGVPYSGGTGGDFDFDSVLIQVLSVSFRSLSTGTFTYFLFQSSVCAPCLVQKEGKTLRN